MSKMKESMYMLKSSLAQKYSELNSSTDALYDKLLAKFDAYQKNVEQSKSEDAIDGYKLGYLDCKSGATPCHSIEDEDVEMFCIDMPPTQDVQINVVHIKATKEPMVDETTVEEHNAKAGATDNFSLFCLLLCFL
ncbi:unnamed protein product [Prunus brigantina]